MTKTFNYEEIWEHTENLPWCALVTTGRVGTDFFQSLLDSHPEIFVYNGILFFYEFWNKTSYCIQSNQNIEIEDLVNEFIGHFIWTLRSKYDYQERKDQLGENMDQSINIDIDQFREHCIGLLKLKPLSSRYFLQTVYLAYALCLGQSIKKKKVFFHHHHHIWILGPYLKDFPDSKIISMTRDPRATYVSGVEHWRKYDPANHDHLRRVFFILNRTIEDAYPLKEYTTNFKVLKLEDLENEQILNSICEWLGVSFDPCLRQSTWAGMRWWGDRISGKQPDKNELRFSKKNTLNKWELTLNKIDKLIINYLLYERLKLLSYKYREITILDHIIVPILILFPTTYEMQHLSPRRLLKCFLNREYKLLIYSFFYFPRVMLFYKMYFIKWKTPFFLPHFVL